MHLLEENLLSVSALCDVYMPFYLASYSFALISNLLEPTECVSILAVFPPPFSCNTDKGLVCLDFMISYFFKLQLHICNSILLWISFFVPRCCFEYVAYITCLCSEYFLFLIKSDMITYSDLMMYCFSDSRVFCL
ncbi:hypothetical protein S245_011429 [Arachis hypogaea]